VSLIACRGKEGATSDLTLHPMTYRFCGSTTGFIVVLLLAWGPLDAVGASKPTPPPCTPLPSLPPFARPPARRTTPIPTDPPKLLTPLNYELRGPEKFDREGKPIISNLIGKKFTDAEFKLRIKLASRALDQWSQRAEEYGNVTMSSPILSEDQGTFNFTIKDGPDEFFSNAKTRKDGSAAATLAIINQFSASGQATFDPLAKAQVIAEANGSAEQARANNDAAAAQRNAARIKRDAALAAAAKQTGDARTTAQTTAYSDYAKDIAAANQTASGTGSALDPNATVGSANTAKTNLDNDATGFAAQFLKSIGALTDGSPLTVPNAPSALPDRTALIDAAGTNTIKAIFGVLGHPEEAMKFKDKAVLFATVAVAVNPGWRTQHDFAADISGQASYRLIKARPEVVLALRNRLPANLYNCLIDSHGIRDAVAAADAKENPALVAAATKLQRTQSALEEANTQLKVADNAIYKRRTYDGTDKRGVAKDIDAELSKAKAFYTQHELGKNFLLQRNVQPQADAMVKNAALSNALDDVQAASELASGKISPQDSEAAKKLKRATEVLAEFKDAQKAAKVETETVNQTADRLQKLTDLKTAVATANSWADAVTTKTQENEAAKTDYDTQFALSKSAIPANAFESGSGAGDIGDLRPVDEFFDQIGDYKQAPLVAGISPLMETQVLDLKDSYGRQDQVAIALAAALRMGGQKGSAQIFDRYMRQQTKTAVTLSSLPVVNTFSASGGLFGFQVGPRLRALNNPASRIGGSANVLDRQSFPAVLIIGMDRADISPTICKDYDGKYYVFEPQLLIRQTSRWNPLDGKLFTPFKDPWWNPASWINPRYSEQARVSNQISVADNFRDLEVWLKGEDQLSYSAANRKGVSKTDGSKETNPDYSDFYDGGFTRHPYAEVVQSLIRRRDALAELTTGSESRQFLPIDVLVPPKKQADTVDPVITGVFPNAIKATPLTQGGAPDPQDVANAKAKLKDRNDDFTAHLAALTTQITADNKADLAKDDNVKAVAKLLKPTATDDKTAVALQGLQEAGRYLTEISNQANRLSARIASLKTTTDAATPKRVDIVAAAQGVTDQVSVLTPKLVPTAPLTSDFIKAMAQAVGPDLSRYNKDLGTQVATDATAVATAAGTVAKLVDIPTTSPLVPLVIVGHDLNKAKTVEAVLSNGKNTLPLPGSVADDAGQSVTLQDYGILIKMRVGASAVLHLRITCEVPDPAKPGAIRKIVLFTPPILINFGDSQIPIPPASVQAVGAILPDAQPGQPFDAPPDQIAPRPASVAGQLAGKKDASSQQVDPLDVSQNIFSRKPDR